MKKMIACEVVYPVQFQIEIDSDDDVIEIKEQIKSYADKIFDSSSIKPTILSCSDIIYQDVI